LTNLLPALCCGQAERGWKALELKSAALPGATLSYEPGLSGQVGAFRRDYEQFRADQAKHELRVQDLLDKRDDILAEINRFVGSSPNDLELADQRRVFSFCLTREQRTAATNEWRFYLVTKATIKDYLRKGGSLTHFTYDKTTDTVEYSFQIETLRGRNLEFPVPVAGAQSAEREIQAFFSMLSDAASAFSSAAFHEVAELAILSRLRPDDPYFRWFSDGFANAIAIRVMRKHLSEQAVENFMASYKVAAFADLEKQINLCYWMGLDYSVETPLEGEKRLEMARYAYATFEADRLLERHGADCARRILDEVVACKTNDSRCLFPAALKVTGEDLEKRFRRYQPFETKEECVKYYAEKHNDAAERKDYARELPAMLRVLELNGLTDPRFFSNAALLLFRLGHEDLGDRAILKHADFCQRRGSAAASIIMHKVFIDYAMQCRNLQKAVPSAEAVRKIEPEYVPAMTVEMLRLGSKGETEKARQTAGRILELEKNRESPWYQLAEKVHQEAPGEQ